MLSKLGYVRYKVSINHSPSNWYLFSKVIFQNKFLFFTLHQCLQSGSTKAVLQSNSMVFVRLCKRVLSQCRGRIQLPMTCLYETHCKTIDADRCSFVQLLHNSNLVQTHIAEFVIQNPKYRTFNMVSKALIMVACNIS